LEPAAEVSEEKKSRLVTELPTPFHHPTWRKPMSSKHLSFWAASLALLAVTLACRFAQPDTVVVTVEVPVTATPENNIPPQPPQQPPESPKIAVTFQEDFNTTSLDASRWNFGTNSSGSGYKISDDILSIWSGSTNGGGGWMLSQQLFTPSDVSQVFEIRARSTNDDGGSWGFWGDGHEGYLMFGVNESGLFQAWVRADSNAPLESITIKNLDITQWHTYRIEFSASEANFYIDDILTATHTNGIPAGKPMHIRLDRVSWGQNETIYVDYVTIGEYR
jgi:hypothetical protein